VIIIKYLANLITVTRIILAGALLMIKPLSLTFLITYVLCGVSDMLDGHIARKISTESNMGVVLDSVADVIFIGVVLYVLLPKINIPFWLLVWIGSIAIIRCISLLIGFVKYHTTTFLHTYANKITGIFLFACPLFIDVYKIEAIGIVLCVVATTSAIEELIINTRSKELDRNIRGIFY